MKILLYTFYLTIISLTFLFYSCGTSTGSRYRQENKPPVKSKEPESKTSKYPENFNLSGYHAKINIPPSDKKTTSDSLDLWYGYRNSNADFDTTMVPLKTMEGYRVQVLITDDLNEANNMRADVYFKTNQKSIYVVFDPPFYKVEVGDFRNMADAKSLAFQLKQLGYSDARVINETINIF